MYKKNEAHTINKHNISDKHIIMHDQGSVQLLILLGPLHRVHGFQ